MKASTWLGTEALISIALSSFAAFKKGNMPYPPIIVKIALAYGLIGLVGLASEDFAGILGAGFLLARIVEDAGSNWTKFSASPPDDQTYTYLTTATHHANSTEAALGATNPKDYVNRVTGQKNSTSAQGDVNPNLTPGSILDQP